MFDRLKKMWDLTSPEKSVVVDGNTVFVGVAKKERKLATIITLDEPLQDFEEEKPV